MTITKREKILEKSKEIALDSTIHGLPNILKTDKTCLNSCGYSSF